MSEDAVQRLMGLADEFASEAQDYWHMPRDPAPMREARSTLESALREALMPAGWRPIDSAPSTGAVLLAVECGGERKTFFAEQSHEQNGPCWYITSGWCGWSRLHKSWAPIGWMPLPAAPSPEQPEQPLGVSPQAGPRSLVAGLPTIADADALHKAAALAYFALCEESMAYEDPIDHVIKGRDALAPFFPRGVDCRGNELAAPIPQEPKP